jgi:putative IMPACT (imprinted ancient) family translation regulator
MSDTNLSEKIIENITNVLKKSVLFEKANKIENIFIGIALCTGMYSLFTIYNTYTCINIENKIENKIEELQKTIKGSENTDKVNYKILMECQNIIYNMDIKIKNMENKMNYIIDSRENMGLEI